MNGATKAAGGVLGGCGVGGTCYYGYEYVKPTNLEEQLVWDNYTPLDVKGTTSDSAWKLLLQEHVDLKDSNEVKRLTISGLESGGQEVYSEDKVSNMKEACKDLYETRVPEDEYEFNQDSAATDFGYKLKRAKEWCVAGSEHWKKSKEKRAKEEAERKRQEEEDKLAALKSNKASQTPKKP